MLLPHYKRQPKSRFNPDKKRLWRFEIRDVTFLNLVGEIIHKSEFEFKLKVDAQIAARAFMNNLPDNL